VDKANVLASSQLWREIVEEVAKARPWARTLLRSRTLTALMS
jgi:isocitrate/isopropylmalate dehydrogenase